MYSQAKSKLDLLKEEVKQLTLELDKAEMKISEMEEQGEMFEWLPCNTMVEKMMIDRLRDNWDNLTLEDIEAICKI